MNLIVSIALLCAYLFYDRILAMIVISTADKVKSAVDNKEEGEIIMSKKIVVITGSQTDAPQAVALADRSEYRKGEPVWVRKS